MSVGRGAAYKVFQTIDRVRGAAYKVFQTIDRVRGAAFKVFQTIDRVHGASCLLECYQGLAEPLSKIFTFRLAHSGE